MGLLSRIFTRSRDDVAETRADGADYLPQHFGSLGSYGYSDSGVTINESNALISSTVWACVSVIAQTIATLPVHVLTRDGGEKQYRHLGTQPNAFMTPAVFRETLLHNALLWGGGYAAVEKDHAGSPVGLYPLRSDRTRPIRQAGRLVYETRVGNAVHYLAPDQVVCLLGWSGDGISPISPVQSGRQPIGLEVAMGRYAAKAFGGANVGGILETPPLSPDAMKSFVESWRANYSGLDAAFKVAVLPSPMKFTPTTLKPQEAQLTAERQAIVLDICRYYRVPPWMVGVLEKSSYASLEAQSMAFYQGTIQPWAVKLEQELMGKLLLEAEKDALEIRLNLDSLLRATTGERFSAYQQGRQGGWLSINDIRRKEGMPPVDGGDSYLAPLNMTPVGQQTPVATPPAADVVPSEATRSLVEDAARRLLTKESRAVARLLKRHKDKPDEFRAAVAEFYGRHAELVARVMRTPLRAAGLTLDPTAYAARHVAAAQDLITRGVAADDLDDWPDVRAGEIADDLLDGDNGNAIAA